MEFWFLVGVALFIWWLFRTGKIRRAHTLDAAQDRGSVRQASSRQFGPLEEYDNLAGRPAQWIASGGQVDVAGMAIKGGLFYFGESLLAQDGYRNENCLIDPRLKVTREQTNERSPHGLQYWPAYRDITPLQRLTYLHWLSGGRADPSIDIGYVFIYFYGLERRLFFDQPGSEADLLIGEVQRLQSIYGANRSFNSYSSAFLESAAFVNGELSTAPVLSHDTASFDVPLMLRTAIGLKLRDRQTLSWDWLLAWFLAHPDTYLRTPATRCFEEFKLLFERRFLERYPEGLSVRAPRRVISPHYLAASGTFTVTLDSPYGQVPDPKHLKVPIKIAREIAEAVTNELDAYSRYLGRNLNSADTMAAQLLLPRDLPLSPNSSLGRFRAYVTERTNGAMTLVPLQDLLDRLDINETGEKPSAATFKALSKALATCDFGMEPDRVYGTQSISRDSCVALFGATAGGTIDAKREAFTAARIVVELTALAIAADGVVEDSEIAFGIEQIETYQGLSSDERVRLLALLFALIHSPPQQQSLLRRLAKASETIRDSAAQIVLNVVAVDGRLDTDEIRFAEKLYKALNLPTDRLYADLHGLGAQQRRDEPTVVAKAVPGRGHRIPGPPLERNPRSEILLDATLVASKKRESARVSELLATIFVEEDVIRETNPASKSGVGTRVTFDGLDADHSTLIDALIASKEMTYGEFSAMCRDAKLFADGAIETINDWAFEKFDDAIIEEGDPIVIDPDLYGPLVELAQARRGTAL